MRYLISLGGLLVVFALALLVSKNRKEIKLKNIFIMLVIQFILATLLLNTTFGYILIKGITNVFSVLDTNAQKYHIYLWRNLCAT